MIEGLREDIECSCIDLRVGIALTGHDASELDFVLAWARCEPDGGAGATLPETVLPLSLSTSPCDDETATS